MSDLASIIYLKQNIEVESAELSQMWQDRYICHWLKNDP